MNKQQRFAHNVGHVLGFNTPDQDYIKAEI